MIVHEWVEMRKCLDIGLRYPAREGMSIGVDTVQQRGREPLAYMLVCADEILRHNGRGGAIADPDILEGCYAGLIAGVMVDYDVGAPQPVTEVSRLDINHSDLVKLLEGSDVGRNNLDSKQMGHRAVFRPRDRGEGEDRRRELVAAEQSA